MDQLVVDLGGLEGFDPQRDQEVVLLSDQVDSVAGLHALSRQAGLPPHALLSGLGAEIPRVYLAESADQAKPDPPLISVRPLPAGGSSMAAG